ncbi:YcxB family protein [Kangiella sp. TOML190]|uniref:YcxB family protein n=1 Tax=Kangiella sp. TOML190 TaxID=2931351 RepID=UPI00203F8E00|nr:YcxB family protein [Kangiella sp. TOML190]
MEFSIKYTTRDYSAVSKYKIREILLDENKNPDSFWYKVFSNVINVLICTYNKFGKLRHTYHFSINEESLTRAHKKQSGTVGWDRIFNFLDHPKFFLLNLEDGSLVIPKRVLKAEWITRITNLLKANEIEEKVLIDLPSDTEKPKLPK